MRTCRNFAHFDPLTGEVPSWPYPELGDIVSRARRLLSGRTSEQIHGLANEIHELLGEYFAEVRQREVSRRQAEGLAEFLDVDEDGLLLGIHLDAVDELDFRRPQNTNEIDALEASIGRWPQCFGEGAAAPDLGAGLAALALCYVADAVHRLHYEYDFTSLQYVRRDAKPISAFGYIAAGQCAIVAQDAVCRAELVIKTRRLQKQFDERLDAIRQETRADVRIAHDHPWAVRREEEARQRTEHARHMAARSLRRRNASREAVLAEWDRDHALQQLSLAKAGLRLSQWLARQDLEFFEPRTVATWLAAHEKDTARDR